MIQNYYIQFIILLILFILLAINILIICKNKKIYGGVQPSEMLLIGELPPIFMGLPTTNTIKEIGTTPAANVLSESQPSGAQLSEVRPSTQIEYNFSNYDFFISVYNLLNSPNLVEQIRENSYAFQEFIKYKGCKILLRNILMLLYQDEFGEDYNFIQLRLPLFTKSKKFISFLENYWNDDFDTFIKYYEEFKDQEIGKKQSYYFYWINLINISQILVTFLYNGHLLDMPRYGYDDDTNDNSCYIAANHLDSFNEIVQFFMLALDCKYFNILNLYKKIINYEYEFCIKPKLEPKKKIKLSKAYEEKDINKISMYISNFSRLLSELNNDSDVYLLLSANNVNSIEFGKFEGTKFMPSIINPYIYVHDEMRYLYSLIWHDLIFHNSYDRKLHIMDENWYEFKLIVMQSIEYGYYPLIFGLINGLFHEINNIPNLFGGIFKTIMPPFTIKTFLECMPIFANLGSTSMIRSRIVDSTLDPNDSKLFDFLFNAGYISRDIYDNRHNISRYLEEWNAYNISKFGNH
jgi:hypothetical protein